jgi:hypothetical protein
VKREGQAIVSIKTEAFQPERVLSVANTTSDSDGYDDEQPTIVHRMRSASCGAVWLKLHTRQLL